MPIREHRSVSIKIHEDGEGHISEIYQKGKLLHTVHNEKVHGRFHNPALTIEAARDWINRTYPNGKSMDSG